MNESGLVELKSQRDLNIVQRVLGDFIEIEFVNLRWGDADANVECIDDRLLEVFDDRRLFQRGQIHTVEYFLRPKQNKND